MYWSFWRRNWIWIAALALSGVVVCGWFYWWHGGAAALTSAAASSTPGAPQPTVALPELGQAGDMFGGFSALISALAFIGVAVAALLQHEQLRHARLEGEHTRSRAEDTSRLVAAQYARQSFEPLFFQLVSLLRAHAKSAQLSFAGANEPDSIDFENGLRHFRTQMALQWSMQTNPPESIAVKAGHLTLGYRIFYSRNEASLGPYFRTLYHALKLIHRSGLSDQEKVDFGNILRGLLTVDELLLVMINCVAGYGAGLKILVERYGLLKHISKVNGQHDLIDVSLARHGFDPAATMSFGERRRLWLTREPPELVPD